MKLDELNLGNTAVAVVKKEESNSAFQKLDETYSEFSKLVFMFDCSSSMSEHLSKNYLKQYAWTPEVMTAIRSQLDNLVVNIHNLMASSDSIGTPWQWLLPEEENRLTPLLDRIESASGFVDVDNPDAPPEIKTTFSVPVDDIELQLRIVRFNLILEMGVKIDPSKHREIPPTRMDCVRKLAKSEIKKRFDKYPKSNVAVIRFNSTAELLFNDSTQDQLWPLLDTLQAAGGTELQSALNAAMEACRSNPSEVGVHHFIVISDGETSFPADLWIPVLKQSGVVMDYIHIGDMNPNAEIVRACKELNGECVVVNTEEDLQEKFVEAVQRKFLPPASNV